jgi:hypothetical protein
MSELLTGFGTATWRDFWPQLEEIERRLKQNADWTEVIGHLRVAQCFRLPFLWRFIVSVIRWSVDLPSRTLQSSLVAYCDDPQRLTPMRWDYTLEVEFTRSANDQPVFHRAVYRRAEPDGWSPIIVRIL